MGAFEDSSTNTVEGERILWIWWHLGRFNPCKVVDFKALTVHSMEFKARWIPEINTADWIVQFNELCSNLESVMTDLTEEYGNVNDAG